MRGSGDILLIAGAFAWFIEPNYWSSITIVREREEIYLNTCIPYIPFVLKAAYITFQTMYPECDIRIEIEQQNPLIICIKDYGDTFTYLYTYKVIFGFEEQAYI